MILRVLQAGDSYSQGEVIDVAGVGPCQVCDVSGLTTSSQLTTWLSAARTAAEPTTGLVRPSLSYINQSPDTHVYVALDGNGNVLAQITGS